MTSRRVQLGSMVKAHRERLGLSQVDVAQNSIGKTRTIVAYLEQGHRLPAPKDLVSICEYLQIPKQYWESFTDQESLLRFGFEDLLSEFVGRSVNLDMHDVTIQDTAKDLINEIFSSSPSKNQLRDNFNSILIYYGEGPINTSFFNYYFEVSSFADLDSFAKAVEKYQVDAIRLFSTFAEAFETFNAAPDVAGVLSPIRPVKIDTYEGRKEWSMIEIIDDEFLPDLGYISAKKVSQESAERRWLIEQLRLLSKDMEKDGPLATEKLNIKTRRKIDSLLRKFESTISHGVSSPLFQPDSDALIREADRLAPKTNQELARMDETQKKALRNLARYLAADHMDVYVATSMRTAPDFISVNHFTTSLFASANIRPLKLRYFNPTQSWIDDRVAKGLVEALMLKRASVTIYMAQKADTFGKDSEASVALGQGKPVIVYVPKLRIPDVIDSEELFDLSRPALVERYNQIPGEDDADDTMDDEALVAAVLKEILKEQEDEILRDCVIKYWADFDLYTEADRITGKVREVYRKWLDGVVNGDHELEIPNDVREPLIGTLVATAVNFERRAKLFREVHPLALQVILSSGVLNGILVARTVEQCSIVLRAAICNALDLEFKKDDDNYRLVERVTGSTIRVISRHELLQNSFESHYRTIRFHRT